MANLFRQNKNKMTTSKNTSKTSGRPSADDLYQVSAHGIQDLLAKSVNAKENGLLSRLMSFKAPLSKSADTDLQSMWVNRFTNPDAVNANSKLHINLEPKPTLSEIREGFSASGIVMPIPGIEDHYLVVGRRLLATSRKIEAWILPASAMDCALLIDSKTAHHDNQSFEEVDVRHFRLALFLKSRGITEEYLDLRKIDSLTVLNALRNTDLMQCYAEQVFIDARPEQNHAYLLPSLMDGVASAFHRAHAATFSNSVERESELLTTENPLFWRKLNQTLFSIFSLYIATEDDVEDWTKRQERSLSLFKKHITVRDTGLAGTIRLGELIPLRANAPVRLSESNLTALKRLDLSYPGGVLRIGISTLDFEPISALCRVYKLTQEQESREMLSAQFYSEQEALESAETINALEGSSNPVSVLNTHAGDLKAVEDFLAIHSQALAKQIELATRPLEQTQLA